MRHKIGTNEPNFLLVCTHVTCAAVAAGLHYEKAPNCVFCCVPRTREFPLLSDGKFSKKIQGCLLLFFECSHLVDLLHWERDSRQDTTFPNRQIWKSLFFFLPPPGLLREKGGRKEQGRIIPHCQLAIRKSDLCSFLWAKLLVAAGPPLFLKGIFVWISLLSFSPLVSRGSGSSKSQIVFCLLRRPREREIFLYSTK